MNDLAESDVAATGALLTLLRMSKGFLLAALFLLGEAILTAQTLDAGIPTRGRVYHLEPGGAGGEELRPAFRYRPSVPARGLEPRRCRPSQRLPALVVPDQWLDGDLWYSPLPLFSAWAGGLPKALVVHLPSQVFGAYEHGRLVRWGPVSSGREEYPTPPGLFHLNWRSPGRHSTINPEWYMPWYFNFDNEGGLALHQLSLPGRPASHSCIRLLESDARWLYGWGEGWVLDERGWNVLDPGTPVLILGHYDFRAPPPCALWTGWPRVWSCRSRFPSLRP